jgi:hypothetical protein
MREIDMKQDKLTFAVAGALALCAGTANAAVVPYTTIAAFEAAIVADPELDSRTINFDNFATEQTIASGGSFDGLTFTYGPLTGTPTPSLTTVAQPPPTFSPDFQLGTTNDDFDNQFRDGDSITVSFVQSRIFGVVFETSTMQTNLLDSDFYIELLGTKYTIETDDYFEINAGPPATNGYFIGIIADTPFGSINVSSTADSNDPGNLLQYSLDNMVVSVPSPATWMLMGAGFGLLGFRRLRAKA